MSGRTRPVPQVECVAPDDFSRAVVFAHLAVSLVANEIMSVFESANHSRIAVRIGVIESQWDFMQDLTGPIDFDNAAVATLGNHRDAVSHPLTGGDLDALVSRSHRLCVVLA